MTGNDLHDPLGALAPVFEAAPYGVVAAREDGTIVFANEIANTTFGFAPGELIGQAISRVLPTALDGTQRTERSVEGIHKSGARVPLGIGVNVLDAGPLRYIVVSIIDLTARRDSEARVAAAQEHV